MEPGGSVLLTGRDPDRVEVAANEVKGGSAVARVEGRVLNVRDPRRDRFPLARWNSAPVDIVFSNATITDDPKGRTRPTRSMPRHRDEHPRHDRDPAGVRAANSRTGRPG